MELDLKHSTDLRFGRADGVGGGWRTVVDTASAQTLTNKTLTAPVITGQVSDAASVITTKAVTAAESGKTFFLNLVAGFVTTLPAPALGLYFKFIVGTAPTGGSYTIVAPAAATIFKGHVLSNDLNSGTDADFGTAGEATVTIVVNKAVAGDVVEIECDGTNYFVSARCSVFDAITIS